MIRPDDSVDQEHNGHLLDTRIMSAPLPPSPPIALSSPIVYPLSASHDGTEFGKEADGDVLDAFNTLWDFTNFQNYVDCMHA